MRTVQDGTEGFAGGAAFRRYDWEYTMTTRVETETEILWLGEAACHDRSLVGGKAAQLSRLAAGYRVPPGFCLTSTAFAGAQANSDAGNDRRNQPVTLPPSLFGKLTAAYQTLAARSGLEAPPVAVRSSATDEDGNAASFAGQHDTYLNITGSDAVAEAVIRCWASFSSERALAYRRQQGLPLDAIHPAVLIQHLVVADVSAVVFSANPVTGKRDEIVINATWGLGESLVSGTVTPDTYLVRKEDLTVTGREIGDKQRMTVAIPEGTREVDVPRLLRRQPALDDAQAIEMAQLAQSLDEAMGYPVDVECAFSGGRLYLLQCRPITRLPGSK
jgi:pyruvate,water dikinase